MIKFFCKVKVTELKTPISSLIELVIERVEIHQITHIGYISYFGEKYLFKFGTCQLDGAEVQCAVFDVPGRKVVTVTRNEILHPTRSVILDLFFEALGGKIEGCYPYLSP